MKKPKFDCNEATSWGLFINDGLGWYLHSAHWDKTVCVDIGKDRESEDEHYSVRRILVKVK